MIGAMPSTPEMAFVLAIAVLSVLVATSWFRLHPFLVLIATAYAVAFASGLSLALAVAEVATAAREPRALPSRP